MRKLNIFGGGKMQDNCIRNKDSGELECERKVVNKDGTTMTVAGFKMSVDANCTPVMTEAFDLGDGGHLQELEKKFVSKTVAKCQKTGHNVPREI